MSAGSVPFRNPILREVAKPFDLPTETAEAQNVVEQLLAAMDRVNRIHNFSKGMGVAAPQIGIARAVALVRTPEGDLVTLLNPRVIDESGDSDEQYEGCLSFFDVRGMVVRPLTIEVEHQDPDGTIRITTFSHGMARLVGHEIDHLFGSLYRVRMRTGVSPIPVSEYTGTGSTWSYGR